MPSELTSRRRWDTSLPGVRGVGGWANPYPSAVSPSPASTHPRVMLLRPDAQYHPSRAPARPARWPASRTTNSATATSGKSGPFTTATACASRAWRRRSRSAAWSTKTAMQPAGVRPTRDDESLDRMSDDVQCLTADVTCEPDECCLYVRPHKHRCELWPTPASDTKAAFDACNP